jgi:hypothetical protein
MHVLSTAALIAALSAAVSPIAAHAGNLLDLSVIDRDNGRTLPTYRDHGKLYVAGTPGHRYSVRLTNRSGGRVLAVLSVDGVNAVTGATANPDQTGYVLDAWQSTDIAGWRKSNDEIAQFNFTALPSSYAARTGRPANVGVIGVAVFAERAPVYREREADIARAEAPPPPMSSSANDAAAQPAMPAGAASTPAPASARKAAPAERMSGGLARSEDKLGTGHGAREYSHVDNVDFERATRDPAERISIWYDSYDNLVADGIINRPIARRDADPFPNGFVPDPPAR